MSGMVCPQDDDLSLGAIIQILINYLMKIPGSMFPSGTARSSKPLRRSVDTSYLGFSFFW
jgi:hypothetical protein